MRTANWFKLAAIGVAGIAILAAAFTPKVPETAKPMPIPPAAPQADPLKAELARCQTLGEAGAHDRACLDAWAANRRRFLGDTSYSGKD